MKKIIILGMLVVALVLMVIFTGCDLSVTTIVGGVVLGGIIGGALGHIFIGILIGGVIGFILFMVLSSSGGGSSSGGSSSSGFSSLNHTNNRENYPGKCISCTKFLSRGECRLTGKPVSEMDSCSNWC